MANTTHLELPLMAAAQAQKHVTHNEAIQRVDALVQLAVKDRHLTSPPGAPSDGDRHIPASGATGAWAAWDLNIAWYVDGVWTKLVPRSGWMAYVENEGIVLIHDGSGWVKLPAATGTWQVLSASAVAIPHTGSTAETTLATVPVPGGSMGANGALRITTAWSHTNSVNDKTVRTKFGATAYGATTITTSASLREQCQIANRNAVDSQVGMSTGAGGGWGQSAVSPTTSTHDTTSAVDITFTAQLADSGETITLESYLVELLYSA